MTTCIYVGDPHVVPSELEECERLVGLVEATQAISDPAALVVLLGDQHHNHGVVSLRVQAFWQAALRRLGGAARVVALVGNHDKEVGASADTPVNVMRGYADAGLCQLANPRLAIGPLLFVSHTSTDDFLRVAAGWPGAVVCHQTFDGARAGNGFDLRDGVAPGALAARQVVSGHIHLPQEVGRVWYPGAPRWRHVGDADAEDRAIWVVVHADDGSIASRTKVSTRGACRRIRVVVDSEAEPLDLAGLDPDVDHRFVLVGTSAWVRERQPQVKRRGRIHEVSVTDRAAPVVSEADGPRASLRKYLEGWRAPGGTPGAELAALADQRVWGAA